MRKVYLVLASFTLIVFLSKTANATDYHPRFNRVDNLHACPQKWGKSIDSNRSLAVCEAKLFHVSVDTTKRVGNCESGFQWWEYYSGNAGNFQHRLKYWGERYVSYGAKAGGFYQSPYNGRTNDFVTMKMVRDVGWGPWSCY